MKTRYYEVLRSVRPGDEDLATVLVEVRGSHILRISYPRGASPDLQPDDIRRQCRPETELDRQSADERAALNDGWVRYSWRTAPLGTTRWAPQS